MSAPLPRAVSDAADALVLVVGVCDEFSRTLAARARDAGAQLRHLRESLGWSQNRAAQAVGCKSAARIRALEDGAWYPRLATRLLTAYAEEAARRPVQRGREAVTVARALAGRVRTRTVAVG